MITNNQDIIDRVKMRKPKKLLCTENNLFTGGPVVVYKWRPGTGNQIEYLSPNLAKQFGYQPKEFLLGKLHYASLIHPEDQGIWVNAIRVGLTQEKPFFEMEYRIRKSDGEYRWVYDYVVTVRDATGRVKSCHGYILDITGRKNSEKALQENAKKYRELVEDANVIAMHLNEKGQILFINEFGLKFFGRQPSELLHHSFKDTLLPQFESSGRNLWDAFDDMFNNPAKYTTSVFEHTARDGRRVWVEWTNRLFRDLANGQSRLVTVGFDVTARQRAEIALKFHYERQRRNQLIYDVLDSRISEKEFFAGAEKEGFRLETPLICCFVIFDFSNSRLKFLEEDREEFHNWVETAVDLVKARLGGLVWYAKPGISILKHIPATGSATDQTKWVTNLPSVMKDVFRGVDCVIGISTVHAEIKTIYREAREAARIGPIFQPDKQIFRWRDLGISKLIFQQANTDDGKVFVKEWIGPLIEKPSSKNQELLSTLKELISGDTINAIANRLHIHPKTLVFRKGKIEKILQVNIDDPEIRLNIAAALKLKQLQKK